MFIVVLVLYFSLDQFDITVFMMLHLNGAFPGWYRFLNDQVCNLQSIKLHRIDIPDFKE